MHRRAGDGRCVCLRLEFAQVRAEAMGALGEDKSEMRIVTVNEHGQSAEILKGILRHTEIGLCRERFPSLGEPDQASVRWRIGNIVHAFIVASVLSGIDVVRIDVEVQKVLQGLRRGPTIYGEDFPKLSNPESPVRR
jgi:hypothetical protein